MNDNSKVPRIYKNIYSSNLHGSSWHQFKFMINPEHSVDVKDCVSVQLKNMHVIDLVMSRPNINLQFKAHNIY